MTTTAGVTLIMATVLVVTAGAARAGVLTAEADGVKVALGSEPAEPGASRKTTYTLRLVEASGTLVTGARVTLSGKMGDGMSIDQSALGLGPWDTQPSAQSGEFSNRRDVPAGFEPDDLEVRAQVEITREDLRVMAHREAVSPGTTGSCGS